MQGFSPSGKSPQLQIAGWVEPFAKPITADFALRAKEEAPPVLGVVPLLRIRISTFAPRFFVVAESIGFNPVRRAHPDHGTDPVKHKTC